MMHTKIKTPFLLALATTLVVLVFFDVVFLRSSLQPSNIIPRIAKPNSWTVQSIFPLMSIKTLPGTGYADLGASAWQSEPARYFMARSFREGESPWWNPYSAAGTIGPETLVDIKFSPFTVISAWLFNAAPESFDFGLLIIYTLGAFCVLLILHHSLQLSILAALAGAIFYLLNGFALPNLNSHMGQPYFFSPLLLLALFLFSEKQNSWRWLFVVFTHALLLLITFLPTLLLVLFTTHTLNLAYYFQKRPLAKSPLYYFILLAAATVAGFLLVTPLWLPILDSFSVSNMLTSYNARGLQTGRELDNLLSVFTPKHFWENYSGMFPEALYPKAGLEKSIEVIAHTGVFAALIASYAFGKESLKNRPLVIACAALVIFSYARVFGFMPFVDYVPILRSIGIQYFGCISALALIILVACGIENISLKKISSIPAIIVLLVVAFAFIRLYLKLGFPDLFPYNRYLKIIIYEFFLACLIIFLVRKPDEDARVLAIGVIGIMLLELVFYMNTLRPLRYNPVETEPEFISVLKGHVGDARVLNIGLNHTLYPEYGAMYGIKQLDSQNPGLLPWYENFYRRHIGSDTWLFLTLGNTPELERKTVLENTLSEAALDIANVKYILVVKNAKPYLDFFNARHYPLIYQNDDLCIFENTKHLQTAVVLPALLQSALIPETATFDPATTAVSDDATLIAQATQLGIPVLNTLEQVHPALPASANIRSYHNTEIVLDTESSQAGILALSEVWHPNWKATVDGQPIYIGRINEAFRGIALPAGKHHIRIYYESVALRYGIYIACITAAIVLLLAFLGFYSFPKHRG